MPGPCPCWSPNLKARAQNFCEAVPVLVLVLEGWWWWYRGNGYPTMANGKWQMEWPKRMESTCSSHLGAFINFWIQYSTNLSRQFALLRISCSRPIDGRTSLIFKCLRIFHKQTPPLPWPLPSNWSANEESFHLPAFPENIARHLLYGADLKVDTESALGLGSLLQNWLGLMAQLTSQSATLYPKKKHRKKKGKPKLLLWLQSWRQTKKNGQFLPSPWIGLKLEVAMSGWGKKYSGA